MSLFQAPTFSIKLESDPYIFVESEKGYLYPLIKLYPSMDLEVGKQLSLAGMFELFELVCDKVKVGYIFRSSFTTENKGGALVTYLKNKGLAEDYETLLRIDTLVIYNFPNHGTLAVSPKVSDVVQKVLDNQ